MSAIVVHVEAGWRVEDAMDPSTARRVYRI
jgi:hypothetical protein